jgi:hypothetical protein
MGPDTRHEQPGVSEISAALGARREVTHDPPVCRAGGPRLDRAVRPVARRTSGEPGDDGQRDVPERAEQPAAASEERGDLAMDARVGAAVVAMERVLGAQRGEGMMVGVGHTRSLPAGCVQTWRRIVKKPCNVPGDRWPVAVR